MVHKGLADASFSGNEKLMQKLKELLEERPRPVCFGVIPEVTLFLLFPI